MGCNSSKEAGGVAAAQQRSGPTAHKSYSDLFPPSPTTKQTKSDEDSSGIMVSANELWTAVFLSQLLLAVVYYIYVVCPLLSTPFVR